MTDQTTTVDIMSLEDFRATLATRLTEAQNLLTDMRTKVDSAPPFGGFVDATDTTWAYGVRHTAHIDRVERLVASIIAARDATDTIISNYRTTEARNDANVGDIAAVLGGVTDALNGGSNDTRAI